MWKEGRIDELMRDNRIIPKKLTFRPKRTSHDITRIFSKLMFEGKVGSALKFLDENADNSVHKSTDEVIAKLRTLHPEPHEILPITLIGGPLEEPISPAHFNNITEEEIEKAAKKTKSAGGPSLCDASQWK